MKMNSSSFQTKGLPRNSLNRSFFPLLLGLYRQGYKGDSSRRTLNLLHYTKPFLYQFYTTDNSNKRISTQKEDISDILFFWQHKLPVSGVNINNHLSTYFKGTKSQLWYVEAILAH